MALHGPLPDLRSLRRRPCPAALSPLPLASLSPALLPLPAVLSARRPSAGLLEREASSSSSRGLQARHFASALLSRALALVPRVSLPRALARLRMSLALRSASGLRLAGRTKSGKGGDVRDVSDDRFRLNGLRWHHLAIAAHLHALHERAAAAGDARVVENAFGFVLANVWVTYNTLERDVLFPWVAGGARDDPRVARALSSFASERDRIERAAKRVHAAMRDIVARAEPVAPVRARRRRRRRRGRTVAAVDAQKHLPVENAGEAVAATKASESGDIARVAKDIAELIEDAERLHRAERDILFPIIAARFSAQDQQKLTTLMVGAMDSGMARLQLVNYYETLKKMGNKDQLKKFQEEVPTPVRFLLPVWKARLYDTSPLAELHRPK